MGIVKLVCQGCGANLDALDNQRVLQCGYCGTSNQIKPTVYQQPTPQPPPPVFQQPVTISYSTPQQAQKVSKGARRGIIAFVVITALLPLIIGLIVAFAAVRTTTDVIRQVGFPGSPRATSAAVATSKYRWESERPFVADVNGDHNDDLIGIVQVMGSQELVLTARLGGSWTTAWETSLGSRASIPGRPILRFDPREQLVLFAIGASLTAYDAKTGSQRWVSNFSDAVDSIARDGEQLRVFTIDKRTTAVSPVDGKPSGDEGPVADSATPLADDQGYELIPELRTLDLKYNEFPDLRVEGAFCPNEHLPLVHGRRHAAVHMKCSFPHGLAWAVRAQGTQVPFLLGYDRGSKAERWRVQLTKPGTLETVDTGFGQPRAELFGDDAIVSFLPPDGFVRIQRISLVDGKPKWEAKIASEAGDRITGISVGEDYVFVSSGGEVHVLDRESGESKATLGDW